MRRPSRDRRRRQRPHPRDDANSKGQNENKSSAHAKRCIPDASECQEARAKCGGRSYFFPRVQNGRFYLLSEKKKDRKLLTFAFCSPIVRGGRGNGKRVAFSSIAFLALTKWAPPVENSEP